MNTMKTIEKQLKALANARRLSILKYLKMNREASVGDVAAEIKLSFKATSKHLGILYAADMLEKEQRSLAIYYRLAKSQQPVTKQVLSVI